MECMTILRMGKGTDDLNEASCTHRNKNKGQTLLNSLKTDASMEASEGKARLE